VKPDGASDPHPNAVVRAARVIGPGLLMAGAAIGVSHLMQSTRAGATFGFQLAGLVLAANLFKYPFFEYGHRYAAATGESLLHGYLRMGRGFLWLFFLINTVTAVISIAGVTLVTAALAQNLFRLGLGTTVWSAVLMVLSAGLVIVGHYRSLDLAMKVMMAVLFVATVLALAAAVWHGPVAPPDFAGPSPWRAAAVGFLIALMGWMPAPIELSVWQSLWIGARDRATGRRTSVSDARTDFNLGYALTTVLAVVFLSLGALVMYGTGREFATSNVAFASQLVSLYSTTLGAWTRPIVATAALMAMVSTTLTVIDAYPRSLAVTQHLLQRDVRSRDRRLHAAWMVGTCLVALVMIHSFSGRFTQLVDLATTIAFLAAPVFAALNMRLVASPALSDAHRPGPVLRGLAVAGMVFLVGFSLIYLAQRFVPTVWSGP
jgi:Mn2+/Fe2+ NRAMP family transporter